MIGRSHSPGWRVDLGPRADADPLARELRRRIVANLEHGGGYRAFRSMWGTVVVVAVLEDGPTTRHKTLTLRFDWGRLMIHEGRVGRPDVTLWGTPEGILGMGMWGRWPRLGRTASGEGEVDVLEGDSEPSQSRTTSSDGEKVQPVWRRFPKFSLSSWRRALSEPRKPSLKIYGAALHPRFVWRLAQLIGQP